MNLQIYEEASEWVVKHRNGELDIGERKTFDHWLRESPQHVRAYLEMSSLWEDVPSLDPHRNPDAEELIARARADQNVVSLLSAPTGAIERRDDTVLRARELDEAVPPVRVEKGKHRRGAGRLVLALAASVLLASVGVWVYSQQGVYRTTIGEQRSLALPDGSTVELNSKSRIKVMYGQRERRVELLEGQALFRVARNTTRPFIVETGRTQIRAVGTAFDVYRTRQGAIVTVVEGRVLVQSVRTQEPSAALSGTAEVVDENGATGPPSAVAKSGAARGVAKRNAHMEIILDAGEQLSVTPTAIAAPKPADIAAATAWTRRSLVFDSSPLTDVAREFNRYNARQLVIEDPALESFLVSGVFSSVEPGLLLRFLRAQPELVIQETDSEIRISER